MFKAGMMVIFTILLSCSSIVYAQVSGKSQNIAAGFDSQNQGSVQTVKVVSFNAWVDIMPKLGYTNGYSLDLFNDVPKFTWRSESTGERVVLQAEALAKLNPDIICLQEVWNVFSDNVAQDLIAALAEKGFKYKAVAKQDHGVSGFFAAFIRAYGNGLIILSKYPLDETVSVFNPEADSKRMVNAIKTRVELPRAGWTDLFNIYIPAEDEFSQLDNSERTEEINNLSEWVQYSRKENNVIVAATYNSTYVQFESARVDTLAALNLTPQVTVDSANNRYALDISPSPLRADTIFTNGDRNELVPVKSELVLNQRLDAIEMNRRFKMDIPYLSNHYGVMTTFKVNQ